MTNVNDTLTQAAQEIRDYAQHQEDMFAVRDESLDALADQLDGLTKVAWPADAPALSISEIQDRLTRAKSPLFHAIGHTDVRIVLTALRSPSVGLAIVPRQSNAPNEAEEVDPRRLDVGDPEAVAAHRRNEALLDGGQRAHPEAGTVPFEDAGLDEDPLLPDFADVDAEFSASFTPTPGHLQPEGEFMTLAEAHRRGYEAQYGDGQPWRDASEIWRDEDADEAAWVLARPKTTKGYTVEAFAGHFTFKHNGQMVEEYNTHAALCERIQELLNRPEPTPAPRAADLMRADKRNPRMIAEEGVDHHLLDVKREARGPFNTADRTSMLIRGAIRDGRRTDDPDGLAPFYVLAALRELGVQL